MEPKTLKKGEILDIERKQNKKLSVSTINGNISLAFFEPNGSSVGQLIKSGEGKIFSDIEKYGSFRIECVEDVCTVSYKLSP